jgi:HEAT repeat protein
MAALINDPLLKSKHFWMGACLAMADAAAGTVVSIYSYTIVLSDYPSHVLVYYIVLQTICSAILRTIGLRLIKKNYKNNTLIQYAVFICCFIVCITLMLRKYYYTSIIVAVISSGIVSLETIVAWSMLSLSFGMREYKIVAKYCNQAAYFGTIVACFIIPLLAKLFSNLSLLVFSTLLLLMCMLAVYKLPIQEPEYTTPQKKNNQAKQNNRTYPIYYYLMAYSILIATILVISQYTMRIESATHYTHEELSSFFGYFSGVCNTLGLLASSASTRILKYFGLQSLLCFIPGVSMVVIVFILFSHSFWGVILFGGIRAVFGYSYGTFANEITLNILPPNERFIKKANIKSTANVISTIILALLTVGKNNVFHIIWPLIPVCGIALWLTFKIKRYYKTTLEQESAFKRYNLLEKVTPKTRPMLNHIALTAVRSQDPRTIFYGIDLLTKLYKTKALPDEVYLLLTNEHASIRLAFISYLALQKNPSAIPYLSKQVLKETEKELQFKLVETILCQDVQAALSIVYSTPLLGLELIIKNLEVLINNPTENTAIQALTQWSHSPDSETRKIIASLIGEFKLNTLNQALEHLILDPNQRVSDLAIHSVELMQQVELIPPIVTALFKNTHRIKTRLTLISLGPQVIPHLLKELNVIHNAKTIMKIIASIPGKEAEQALITVIETGSIYYRSLVAKYTNRRACHLPISNEFKLKINAFIQEEVHFVVHLNQQISQSHVPEVQVELNERIRLAKIRFLEWLAIATSPKKVNHLMSSVLDMNYTKNERVGDQALELLELYVQDKQLINSIEYLFEQGKKQPICPLTLPPHDPWLETIVDTKTSTLSIIFDLRAIRLFNHLPAEILLALAEEVTCLAISPGELIFKQNDLADGLYCVRQGEVDIIRDNQPVATITAHGFFGELALLDDEKRVASAIAKTTCNLMYIEKRVFNKIADDVPDILKTVLKVTLEYLRTNLKHSS